MPARLLGEPLRVSPLPPAEARPARPLRLDSGSEIGVILSRRYYARIRQPAEPKPVRARTALLTDDGAVPRINVVAIDSEAARPYETELGFPVGLPTSEAEEGKTEQSFHGNGNQVPAVRSPTANAVTGAAPTS